MDVADKADAFDGNRHSLVGFHPIREVGELTSTEDLVGLSRATELRGEVHRFTDVVVAFEQQRYSARQTHAHLEVRVREVMDEVGSEGDGRGGIDAHDHDAVTEPFCDPNAAFGGDVSSNSTKLAQELYRFMRTVLSSELRETRQIGKNKRAIDIEVGVASWKLIWCFKAGTLSCFIPIEGRSDVLSEAAGNNGARFFFDAPNGIGLVNR